jgi:outer membrane protein assembly factor BamB
MPDETGLLQSWPEGGPRVLWTAKGLGRGYSSPIITRGTLYITGDVGKELHIFAFDLDGKLKWRAKNGRAWKRSFPGSRAACTYSEGRLYHMNAHGRVVCLDPATGRELWAVNVLERFQARNITWGISECLLIDGPRVIVTPGGKKALMAALDKKTGETVWASAPLAGDRAGYASPVLFELGGRRHIVNCSSWHVFGVDADTGRLLWTHRWPRPGKRGTGEKVAGAPALHDGAVFVACADTVGGVLLRLDIQVDGKDVRVQRAWASGLDGMHGATVIVEGFLYGGGHTKVRGWACVDTRTGKTRYETRDLPKGSVIYADGRLYCLSERGTMALVRPTPQGFQTVSRFRLVQRKRRDVWPHPVICDGRLYLRYHDTLFCYDIRKK